MASLLAIVCLFTCLAKQDPLCKLKEPQCPFEVSFQSFLQSRDFVQVSMTNATTKLLDSSNSRGKSPGTYLSLLLIVLSFDVECNPGPVYPCGSCQLEVSWSHRGVCCDSCDAWFHASCQNINSRVYEALDSSNCSWVCLQCGMPNFSSGMFSFSFVDLENSFAPLEKGHPEPNLDLPPSPPKITSTPKKGSTQRRSKTNTNRGLKVINVNCRSICNKKAEFENLVETVSPDIVVGTESWLSPDVADSEVFPVDLGYTVLRRDRVTTTRDGGVFILVRKQFTVSRVPELGTDCELLWVKIELLGSKPLYVGAYYKPDESDEHSLSELNSSLSQFVHKGNPIWLLGDFNMPKYNWRTSNADPCCKNLALYESFIDLIQDSNLQQMVDFPTRGENVLDLYLTNRPSLVCKVAPPPYLV